MLGADVEESLKNLTVLELQQELKRRGLKRTGAKPRLIQRLKEVCISSQNYPVQTRAGNWQRQNFDKKTERLKRFSNLKRL